MALQQHERHSAYHDHLPNAVINAADRFVLPGFANKNYQVVWSFMVGLHVLAAAIVTLVARPKRRRLAPANPR
jgi:hypothetical protein